MKYEIVIEESYGIEYSRIERHNDDGTISGIPFDEANSDYQQYLIDTDGGLPMPKEQA